MKAKFLILALAALCLPMARADVSAPDADGTAPAEPADKDVFDIEFGPGKGAPLLYAKSGDEKRPWLGVATQALGPAMAAQLGLDAKAGVTVTTVVPSSPAGEAGIRQYDIIRTLDGVAVDSSDTLRELIRGKAKGDKVKLGLLRKGADVEVEATLGEKLTTAQTRRFQFPDPGNRRPMPRHPGLPHDARDFFDRGFNTDDLFHGFGNLDAFADIEDQVRSIQEQMEDRFDEIWKMNRWPRQGNGPARHFMRSENSMMSFSDGEETVTIRREDGKTTVQILGKDGKPTFEGPANTDAERAKLPDRVREKVEEFENSEMNFGDFHQFDFNLPFSDPRRDAPKLEHAPKPKKDEKPAPRKPDRVAA